MSNQFNNTSGNSGGMSRSSQVAGKIINENFQYQKFTIDF
jgi:hypothetical protein